MTKLERHALRRIMDNCRSPMVNGPRYGADMKRESEGDDPKLLDNPTYKKGYANAADHYNQLLEFFLAASSADLRRFAGKPK